ncbi:MAG: hypothetical protein JWO83_3221 [Caulobacteraceae bacterium]|jgi:hypothetical protein|nr:hypothetical protein [Caulobacteraceae bacterium]
MSSDTEAAPAVSLSHGIQLYLLIFVTVVAWVFISLRFFPTSAYAGFLLLWYWATVEKAAFHRLPASVIGALVGAAMGWFAIYMTSKFGMPNGLILGVLPVAVALFVVIMNWLPLVFNGATMLFVTVLGAPLLRSTNYPEFGGSVIVGALFFAAVVYAATIYVKMRSKAKNQTTSLHSA